LTATKTHTPDVNTTTPRASRQAFETGISEEETQDDSIKGVLRRSRAAEQGLMDALLDPRKLHRQLGRRHSRVRQCPAIEAPRESWYVRETPRHGTKLMEAGDRIVVVVKKQRNFGPETGNSVSISAANKVRRGDVRHAVVVRTAKKWQRPDGSVVKFDDNACVLINKAGEPIGSRVSGVVAAELRQKQWSKILSLAPMHV